MTAASTDDSRLPAIEVNSRTYDMARGPVVVVCVDGDDPAYHERAIAAGRMPFLAQVVKNGASLRAESAMPSFTNPNNLFIATGVPPSIHGICGNYFFDRASGEEVMMNDPKWLRAPTIFSAYAEAGAKVAVITAKDKLRRLLGAGLSTGICFSAEHADRVNLEEYGIADVLGLVGKPLPSVYSAALSELVMASGVEVLRRERPDVMYLSLTDYVQHKHAPGSGPANEFYAMLDQHCERLDALGCTLVMTADHGMNAKSDAPGNPVVVYLQGCLDGWLGTGAARHPADHRSVHGASRCPRLVRDGLSPRRHRRQRPRGPAAGAPGGRAGAPVVGVGGGRGAPRAARRPGGRPRRHRRPRHHARDDAGPARPVRTRRAAAVARRAGRAVRPVPRQSPRLRHPPGHRLRNFDAFWVAANHLAR